MKKCFALTFILVGLCLFRVEAQNPNLDFKYALKIYNQTSYERYVNSYWLNDAPTYQDNTSSTFQFLHPTLAFQWNSDISRSHEIEISSFSSQKTFETISIRDEASGKEEELSQGDLNSTYIALRYEFIRNFNREKDSKFIPSFGGSLSPYFRRNRYNPNPVSVLPSSQMALGFRLHVIPRLTYHINSKFFVDLNVPVCVSDVAYVNSKGDYALVRTNKKELNEYQFNQFPALHSARLGFGLKL